jgi:hypothetical protein
MGTETATFHGGITLASILVLTALDWVARWQKRPKPRSSIRQQLRHVIISYLPFAYAYRKRASRYSHISLCLLYSSFTKFMLLAVLSVWGPQVQKDIPPTTYVHKMPLDSPSGIFWTTTFWIGRGWCGIYWEACLLASGCEVCFILSLCSL